MWTELWATAGALVRYTLLAKPPPQGPPDWGPPPWGDDAGWVLMLQAAAELLTLRGISPPIGLLRLATLYAERRAHHLSPELTASSACALATLGVRRLGTLRASPRLPAASASASSHPLEALGSRLSEVIPDLSPDQLSSLCRHLPRLQPPRSRALALSLAKAALRNMDAVGPAGLPALVLAMADYNVVSAGQRGEEERLAFGVSPGTGQRLLVGLMGASFDVMPQMDGDGLVTLVAGAARLGCRPTRVWMARWCGVTGLREKAPPRPPSISDRPLHPHF